MLSPMFHMFIENLYPLTRKIGERGNAQNHGLVHINTAYNANGNDCAYMLLTQWSRVARKLNRVVSMSDLQG